MRVALILFLCYFLCLQLQAQDSLMLKKYPRHYWALKIGTGELMPYNPMLQFAVEKRTNKLGIQASFGFCIPKSYEVDGVHGKADGYTVRLEGRWYPFKLKRTPFGSPYFGCEVYYKEYKRPMKGDFARSDTSID